MYTGSTFIFSYILHFYYIFSGLYQPLRTLATEANRKHFKCKIVNDVAVIIMDSPGSKVIYSTICLRMFMLLANS